MRAILGHNYIGGRRGAEGSTRLESRSARTGEALPSVFIEATDAEVERAAAAAATAFRSYRHLPGARRSEFLTAIAAELDAFDESDIGLIERETALSSTRLRGELARTSGQLRLFARVIQEGDYLGVRIDSPIPDRQPSRPSLRLYNIGIGPVAVFGASNFPLAFSVAGGDTASALAAGCPVVVKAHPAHLATSELVADAIERAVVRTAMPAGVFNMIYGDRVGVSLVKAAPIRAVAFTGSLSGGRALMDIAAQRPAPIPVFAEMSSINPVLLLPRALATRVPQLAEQTAASVTLGCGQFCTKPGIVLGVRSTAFDRYRRALAEAMTRLSGQVMLHAGILQRYLAGVSALERTSGVIKLAQGSGEAHEAVPMLFQADVALLEQPDSPAFHEVFGPCTVLVELEHEAQFESALSRLGGQLTVTLHADETDLDKARDLLECIEENAGRIVLNGFPTGVEVAGAMVHGGPYPATSDSRATSVGSRAIERFLRPVCYQGFAQAGLPPPVQDANPLGLRARWISARGESA